LMSIQMDAGGAEWCPMLSGGGTGRGILGVGGPSGVSTPKKYKNNSVCVMDCFYVSCPL